MNDKMTKLIEREEKIKERFSKVNKAVEAVSQISKTDRFFDMLILESQLVNKALDLKDMQMRVRERIEKEQNKCKHILPDGGDAHTRWKGNDHNWSYYTCVFCDHEDKR
jgi:hypothetical protein